MAGFADFLRNPWSSPYDDSADENQRRQQSGLAWLAAANAVQGDPSLIGGISRGMLGGNQVYGQGISGIAAAQAEEERRMLEDEYRRSLMTNAADSSTLQRERFEFDKTQTVEANTERRKKDAAVQTQIDAVAGSILSQVEPGSVDAAEARALAATGNLKDLRSLSDEIEARKRLEAAGVDPNDPFALEIMKEQKLRREGLGRYYESPSSSSSSESKKSPWEIRSEGGRTAYIPTGGPDSGLKPRYAFEGTDPIREQAVEMVTKEYNAAAERAVENDVALQFDFEGRVKAVDAMLRSAYGSPAPGSAPPRISLNRVIQEAVRAAQENGEKVDSETISAIRRKADQLRSQGVPDEEIARRIMESVK